MQWNGLWRWVVNLWRVSFLSDTGARMGYYRAVYVETASDRFWSFAFKATLVLFVVGTFVKLLLPVAIGLLVLRLLFK